MVKMPPKYIIEKRSEIMVKYNDENKEKLTRARDILVGIANNPRNNKFGNLGFNEINRAKVFRDENNKKYTKFKRYKRGTIVFVRFGINTGQEFSNSHFGIVLDKNDNPSNGKLTILPLSSKQTIDGVNIGKSLFSTIMNNAEKTNKELKEIIYMMFELQMFHNKCNPLPGGIYRITKDNKNYDLWMDFCKRHDPNNKHIPLDMEIAKKWLQSDEDKVGELKKIYNNYNKVSYAKVGSITSVSKLKISKKINDLDPIGEIRLPVDIMEEIDIAIAKKLLRGNWKKI